MESNQARDAELSISIPKVEVPAMKFMIYKKKLYVQMNIKSFVISDYDDKFTYIYQGFLLEVDSKSIDLPISQSSKKFENPLNLVWEIPIRGDFPKIRLLGEFPMIFHPHFTQAKLWNQSEWIDYLDQKPPEQDIGSYILRVARSLKYEDGYVKPDAKKIANQEAAKWYKDARDQGRFPTDDVQLPSGKTFHIVSDKTFEVQNERKFQPKFQLMPSGQLSRKVKFEIKESKPPYSPAERKKIDMEIVDTLNSDWRWEQYSSLGYELYLIMNAFEVIKHHIGWGERTSENVVEQGGILLGDAFRNPDTGVVYAIAEQAIPGRLAIGSPGYLEVTHETWKEMLDHVDRLGTQLQVIGWYHTHPNNLDVFMSGTDRTTQQRLFGNDWQFAIVLNPHKQIWRAFYGADSRECRGYVLASKALPSASS